MLGLGKVFELIKDEKYPNTLFEHKHVGLRVLRYTPDKVERDSMPGWLCAMLLNQAYAY
jgi:hypothetical protein